jgi:anti-sigma factor RsiW
MSAAVACVNGVDWLMDYLEGTLPAPQRVTLDAHLQDCARCVAFIRSYRATPGILRVATQTEMPEEARESLRLFLARR